MANEFSRAQFANFVVYHSLLTLVNLLNLPLPQGTFFPRRGVSLTVLDRDVERLRMLKKELDVADPGAVRGYLLGVKALHFEIGFALHQEPQPPRNEVFFADFDRLGTLVSQAATTSDAEEMRDLAYKLSVMLPFYDDVDRMTERNRVADAWYRKREG